MSTLDKDGGPAFPMAYPSGVFQHGMTLRDWFAGQWLANYYALHSVEGSPVHHMTAKVAYMVADAMIAERERDK